MSRDTYLEASAHTLHTSLARAQGHAYRPLSGQLRNGSLHLSQRSMQGVRRALFGGNGPEDKAKYIAAQRVLHF
jgi:hypothetical protein